MTKVTHIRRVTPAHFANWLEKRTANIYAETFSTERGRISMQTARAHNRGNWNIPTEVIIEGCYIYPHATDRNAEVATRSFDCIRFELTPLDEVRTEITTVCNESTPILAYCDELIAEMEQRWPAEVNTIQLTASDMQPTTNQAGERQKVVIGLLLVSALALALFAITLLVIYGVLPYPIGVVFSIMALCIVGATAWLSQLLTIVEKLFPRR